MRNMFKVALGVSALAAAAAVAAPQYAFPQNKANPNGITVKYADTDMIKSHFKTWMGAWYKDRGDGSAWVLSPEGDCSTVSEGIAYGMLLMVYMSDATNDYQSQFDKLWATWKKNAVNANTATGMNWRISDNGCSQAGGTGSATDADLDAALALAMAAKQWNNTQYDTDAKALMSWIYKTDVSGSRLKPGSGWDSPYNPSYAALATLEFFKGYDTANQWASVLSTAEADLLKCQNATSGLVGDWCDVNSGNAIQNSAAAVSQNEPAGFYDDAARTPWRTAWSYYWYGNANAKKFNANITKWLYTATTMDAAGIVSGYLPDGTASTSSNRQFVSSTFSGGLGLAASSDDSDNGKNYMETVYKALSSMTSKASPTAEAGEKYYPATLNVLYLLIMSGNMPNFYDMSKFTAFTPDKSLMRQVTMPAGVQQKLDDENVGLDGFWKWGAYHDKWPSTGTTMKPNSGTSPLFYNDGVITAEAVMEIGPEPEYGTAEANAGHYPSAGIALSFLADESGVDFSTLGVKAVRFSIKTQGTIRFALLSTADGLDLGGDPGKLLDPSSDYKTITVSLDYNGMDFKDLEYPDWATKVMPEAFLKNTKGVKFEAKMAKGGFGSISLKSLEFLDASGKVIDPSKITGVTVAGTPTTTPTATSSASANPSSSASGVVAGSSNSGAVVANSSNSGVVVANSSAATGVPTTTTNPDGSVTIVDQNGVVTVVNPDGSMAIAAVAPVSAAKISVSGMQVQISGAKAGANFAVFSMQGKVIASGKVYGASQSITLPNKGAYLVRVGSSMTSVVAK